MVAHSSAQAHSNAMDDGNHHQNAIFVTTKAHTRPSSVGKVDNDNGERHRSTRNRQKKNETKCLWKENQRKFLLRNKFRHRKSICLFIYITQHFRESMGERWRSNGLYALMTRYICFFSLGWNVYFIHGQLHFAFLRHRFRWKSLRFCLVFGIVVVVVVWWSVCAVAAAEKKNRNRLCIFI